MIISGMNDGDQKLVMSTPPLKAQYQQIQILYIWSYETCFSQFSYHNFEDVITNIDKDMFRKESFCGTNSYS